VPDKWSHSSHSDLRQFGSRLGGPQTGSGCDHEEINLCPCPTRIWPIASHCTELHRIQLLLLARLVSSNTSVKSVAQLGTVPSAYDIAEDQVRC